MSYYYYAYYSNPVMDRLLRIPRSKLEALTKEHIERYRNMAERAARGEPFIRGAEARMYLATWETVAEADYDVRKLTPQACGEIEDALDEEGL